MSDVKLILGDCLTEMKKIPDKSIDLVLTDPPYGMTNNEWDTTEKLPEVFKECLRVLKDSSPLVFTAAEPFSYRMYFLLEKYFKHSWLWDKNFPGSFMNAKFAPLKVHEMIMVFCKGKVSYYPIMTNQPMRKKGGKSKLTTNYEGLGMGKEELWDKLYPKSVIQFFNGHQKGKCHPTQKPIKLMSYLMQTYCKPDEVILDPFMGSGTTGVACKELGRNFIGIEISPEYFKIAEQRIKNTQEMML